MIYVSGFIYSIFIQGPKYGRGVRVGDGDAANAKTATHFSTAENPANGSVL